MKREICWVVSSPITVSAFLMGHLAGLSRRFDVTVMANTDRFDFLAPLGPGVQGVSIRIERKIAPLRDLVCLLRLARYFRRRKFAAVHSVTPKAGLLSMAAAFLARVPVRIHTFTGQVWATRSGFSRRFLRALDKTLAALATHIFVDSPSQKAFLVNEKVVSEKKAKVLAHGSISGVDAGRFRPDPSARAEVRAALNLPENALVFLFVGRFTFDKGLTDLARAFCALCEQHPGAHLVLVGPDEGGVLPEVRSLCPGLDHRIRHVGYTDEPERYMAAADVFCLPSYREGFGAVIIEAAAAGIPAIGSRIYGVTDAIQDEITGLLHEPRDSRDLFEKMELLARDEGMRREMGARARERAVRDFSRQVVTGALLDFYASVLGPCTVPG